MFDWLPLTETITKQLIA